ncbi:hypothetical protein PR202_ga18316 [Eleusine coracana subsp. coracana]|uniref:SET domain-containing protein n=1 Tax=Eleusine coracana subsp. coracana TaxID=191504 RepID=A0AAV5CSJ5_ELECO|nr:hypothetical protein PR202_ga18316 [Eleusine coracana subsp. coracana]
MAADEADAKLQSFLQWLQANGADLRGCTIRGCVDKVYGVFSTAVEPGSTDGVVMVVPLDLAITPMRVLQDPLVGPRLRALFEEGAVDGRLLVMLFLMAERLRPGSLWKPYLDMLPSTFGNSLWFTDEELAELEGTTLYRATVMQRKSLQTVFKDKVKGLVEELLHVDESGRPVLIFCFNISIEVLFEDFLWANSIFWTRALNIPCPRSYMFLGSSDDQLTRADGDHCSSSLPASAHQETDITAKSSSVEENSELSNHESIWVEGLVPGIDFCNHSKCSDSILGLFKELLYLYGFVLDNNPDDYLMVHYPVEALRQVQSSDIKMKLLEIQKGELRCLLPRSLLDNGFFGVRSGEENDNKKKTSPSSFSWSSQRKVPSYLNKIVFPQEFLSILRTIAMQEHELEQVGCSEDRETSDLEVQNAIWEVCGDHGSLGLLVDLLRVKSDENKNKSKVNYRSCIVYRRGQKQLARLFLREAEHLLELSANE